MTRMTDTNLVERAQKAAQFELNIALELGHYETAERMQTIIDALRFQRAALSRKEGVEPEPVAWQWRYRYSDNEWGPWQVERRPDADDLLAGNVLMAEEKRPLYASPAPSVQPVVKGLDDLIAEFERLRDKHSSPTGDEYTCGAWDAAQRLICVARRLSALARDPVPAELWALCYLHDWDPPKEGQEHRWEPGKNVFPQVHAFYTSWQEAEAVRRDMGDSAGKYWVVKARPESEARLKSVAPAPAPADKAVVNDKASHPNGNCYFNDYNDGVLTLKRKGGRDG
jgi:hypothetical protein